MARKPPAGPPPQRSLEIYHEWVCEGVKQAQLSEQLGLTQPRIAQLCREVREWVDAFLPDRAAGLDAGRRLHLAIALRRARLAAHYEPVLEPFGGLSGVRKLWEQKEAADAGLLTEAKARELPPWRLLVVVLEMLVEMEELRELEDRGPLAGLLDRIPKALWGDAPSPDEPALPLAAETESSPLSASASPLSAVAAI